MSAMGVWIDIPSLSGIMVRTITVRTVSPDTMRPIRKIFVAQGVSSVDDANLRKNRRPVWIDRG